MLTFEFSADDVLRTRFAVSPLYELMQSVAALRDPAGASIHLPWVRAAASRVAGLDLSLLRALVPPGGAYQPDFVAPPPRTPLPDVAAEMERVLAAPPEQVRAELAMAYPGGVPAVLRPLLQRPREALEGLVAALSAYWERALAPWWDAIQATLQDDIAYRARPLTTAGPIQVFGDLHPDVRWRDSRLEVRRDYDGTVALDGRGLMLMPSAFAWPRVGALWDTPWQPALVYPARGVGTLWAATDRDARHLAQLIGARRARILADLDREASTTSIARRLAASPAGVSEHLGILRRAGLIRARRHGREVLYSRTPAGDTLLRAAP